MKLSLFLSFFAATGALWSHQLPLLPDTNSLDAEVSTNVAFNAERSDALSFGVSMEFAGTLSNCVQVAFGHDDNGDGDLSAVETRFVIGWRGGVYFLEDVSGRQRFEEMADAMPSDRRFELGVRLNKDCIPKQMAVSNESGSCFADLSASVPSWLYSKDWNLMKVTRRGVDAASERIDVECRYKFFRIVIR